MFALDVFDEGLGFWRTVFALFMHLVPTWIVLAVLAVSWRWGLVGVILFAALGRGVPGHGLGAIPLVGLCPDLRPALRGGDTVPGRLAVPGQA